MMTGDNVVITNTKRQYSHFEKAAEMLGLKYFRSDTSCDVFALKEIVGKVINVMRHPDGHTDYDGNVKLLVGVQFDVKGIKREFIIGSKGIKVVSQLPEDLFTL